MILFIQKENKLLYIQSENQSNTLKTNIDELHLENQKLMQIIDSVLIKLNGLQNEKVQLDNELTEKFKYANDLEIEIERQIN